jgi:hypothetical protein
MEWKMCCPCQHLLHILQFLPLCTSCAPPPPQHLKTKIFEQNAFTIC